MGLLVNIDNGGTFTDVCIADGERVTHAKTATTPHDLTQCFIDVLSRASEQLYGEADLPRLIQQTDYLRYSTTSGTNAIVERKGTATGLLVESGEEKSLYGASKDYAKSDLWKIMVPGNASAVPKKNGSLDTKALVSVVNEMLSTGVSRLVIALPSAEDEEAVKDALLESYPRHLLGAVPFLVSHELSADQDDARRMFTAIVNSFLHPGMERFLYGAESVCKSHFLQRPLLIFRNDGDSARVAKTTAIKTWGSGPRGGLEGAAAYAAHYDLSTVVSMDIGGTTTDISVINDNKVALLGNGKISGLDTSFSLPRLESFGLGGSSVIRVENAKISIGPESVGAVPGPACFGRGGQDATLTDALLLAGVIDGEAYLGGELNLDAARAEQAINTNVAEPLGVDLDAAVIAVMENFNAAVGECIKQALAASGASAANATLVAYGGAGPMVACGIAKSAGLSRVIVPSMSAVFSAFGVGFSDIAHEYQAPSNAADLEKTKAQLQERAERDMYGEGVDVSGCEFTYSALSSEGENLIKKPLNGSLPKGASVGLKASYPLPNFSLESNDKSKSTAAKATGDTTVLATAGRASNAVFAAEKLAPGNTLNGPALLRSHYLTCLIDDGWSLKVSANKDLIVEAQ